MLAKGIAMAKPSSKDSSVTPGRESFEVGYVTPDRAYTVRPKVVVQTKKRSVADRLEKLAAYILSLGDEDFTGYVKINFTQGSVGRVERFEEILRKK